jgi:hypothetical protein
MFLGRFSLVFSNQAEEATAVSRRRFVAKLAERMPTAVAYLHFRADGTGFDEWFRALGERDDPDFVLVLADAVVETGAIAKDQGINAWLQARAMLDVFERKYAELLLQHPLFEPPDGG